MLRNPEVIDLLHCATGYSIWQCQALESTLIHCLLVGYKLDRGAGQNPFDEMFKKHQDLTLGQLAQQIENVADVPEELKRSLKILKKERNWLAHRSWSDTLPYANSVDTNRISTFLERIMKVGDGALQLNKLFADILEQRVREAGVSQEYLDRKTKEIYSHWLAG